MKKILSLMLALIMTLSLVTVSAGAKDHVKKMSFTDVNSITYEEAVGVLSGLGIINGRTDGSFAPSEQLTRGAAAKIVCNMLMGATGIDSLKADSAPFSDVPADSVYAPYIAYCASKGIVSGYADGSFGPYNPLTGYAFMKMLLGTLGYESDKEGYTGENWSVSVAKRGLNIGLTDGLSDELNGGLPIPREAACLLALNTLTADMVAYDEDTSVSIGDISITTEGNAKEVPNALSKDFRGAIKGDTVMQLCEAYFSDLTYATGTDPFMRPTNIWTYGKDIISECVDQAAFAGYDTGDLNKRNVYNIVGNDLCNKITNAYRDKSFVNDKYELRVYVDGAPKFVDGNPTNFVTFEPAKLLLNDTTVVSLEWVSRGARTEIFIEEDAAGKTLVTICIMNDALYYTEDGYDADGDTLSATLVSANADSADAVGVDSVLPASIDLKGEDYENLDLTGIGEKTYLLVGYSFEEDDVVTLEEARTVSGSVSSFRYNASVVIDGISYYWNGRDNVKGDGTFCSTIGTDTTLPSTRKTWQTNFESAAEVSGILDSNGNVFWITESLGYGSYVYIQDFASGDNFNKTTQAIAYFDDGSTEIIDIEKIVDASGTEQKTFAGISACPKHTWYLCSETSEGYTLRYINDTNDSEYEVKNGTLNVSNGDVIVADGALKFFQAKNSVVNQELLWSEDTEFIYLGKDDEVTTYNGEMELLPGLKAGASGTVRYSYIYDDSGSRDVAIRVFVDYSNLSAASVEGGETNDDLFMILQEQGNWTYMGDGTKCISVKAIVNGSETTINVAKDALQTGVLYKNSVINENGYYERGTVVGAADDEISGIGCQEAIGGTGNVIVLNGEDYLVPNNNINLVVLRGVHDLMNDAGAIYTLRANMSAAKLRNLMDGYAYVFDYYGVKTDDDSEVLDELYIYVTSAFAFSGAANGNNPIDLPVVENSIKSPLSADGFDFNLTSSNLLCARFEMPADALDANNKWNNVSISYKVTAADGSPILSCVESGKTLTKSGDIGGKPYYQLSRGAAYLGTGYTMENIQGMTGVNLEIMLLDGTTNKLYRAAATDLTIPVLTVDWDAVDTNSALATDVINDAWDKTDSGVKADLGFNSANTMLCSFFTLPSDFVSGNTLALRYIVKDASGNEIINFVNNARACSITGTQPDGTPYYQMSLNQSTFLTNDTCESLQEATGLSVEVTYIYGGKVYYAKETGLTVDTYTASTPSTPPAPPAVVPLTFVLDSYDKTGSGTKADIGWNNAGTTMMFKVNVPVGADWTHSVNFDAVLEEADGTKIAAYNANITCSGTNNTSGSAPIAYQVARIGKSQLQSGYTVEGLRGKTGVTLKLTVTDGEQVYSGQATGLTIDLVP